MMSDKHKQFLLFKVRTTTKRMNRENNERHSQLTHVIVCECMYKLQSVDLFICLKYEYNGNWTVGRFTKLINVYFYGSRWLIEEYKL